MKKRILISMIMFLMIMLSPSLDVYALSGSVSLSCANKNLKQGETTTCTITGNVANGNISSLELNVKLSSNLTLQDTFTDSNWQGNGDKGRYLLYGPVVSTGNFNIGTFKVKAKENIYGTDEKVSLTNVIYYDDVEYAATNISSVTSNIRIPSNICTLSDIKVSNIEFPFSSEQLSYDLNSAEQSVTISATKTDSTSKISGDTGNKKLNFGKNTFNIVVTAEDGTKKTYVINITKPDTRNANNNLSNLTISSGKINFDKNTTSYNVEVDSNVDKITIDGSLEDQTASFVKGYGPRTVNLKYGKNAIQIKVKAENGSEKKYTINVTRKDGRSSNANLSNITLSAGILNFDKNKKDYQIAVEYNVENLKITATPEDSKSKVEYQSDVKLQVGTNEINIKVIAENESVNEYKIIVIRKGENEVIDNNNYLKELSISGYDIGFNKEKLTYDLTVDYGVELKIHYNADSENALTDISWQEISEEKSILKIIVTAEDSSVREYVININKKIENNLNIDIIIIIIIIILLGLVILISTKLFKNKNAVLQDDTKTSENDIKLDEIVNENEIVTDNQSLYNNEMITENYIFNEDKTESNNQEI